MAKFLIKISLLMNTHSEDQITIALLSTIKGKIYWRFGILSLFRLSGTHTKVCKEGNKAFLYDLSTNGTYLEDTKVSKIFE